MTGLRQNNTTMFRKLLIAALCLSPVILPAQTKITGNSRTVTIENRFVALTFDLKKGVYSVRNIPGNFTPITRAYFQAEGLYSTDTLGTTNGPRRRFAMSWGMDKPFRSRKSLRIILIWSGTLHFTTTGISWFSIWVLSMTQSFRSVFRHFIR